jgi:hypothetical protein
MYDVDDSGSINITEMTSIISTMDELEGEGGRSGKDSPAARYSFSYKINHYYRFQITPTSDF